MNTKISIIVPAYNAELRLGRCLDALIAQTYQNWEALIIDNNSTDNTVDIIKEYAVKDSRIKRFSCDIQGPGPARNVGLDNAKGEFIMFCDADDWYEPTMCAEMLDAVTTSGADSAICSVEVIKKLGIDFPWIPLPGMASNNGRESHFVGSPYFSEIQEIFINGTPFIGLLQFSENMNIMLQIIPAVWNRIFRKSVIDKYNLRFPNLNNSEDALFGDMYIIVTDNAFLMTKKLYNYDKTFKTSQIFRHKESLCTDYVKFLSIHYDWMCKNNIKSDRNLQFFNQLVLNYVMVKIIGEVFGHDIKQLQPIAQQLVELNKQVDEQDKIPDVYPPIMRLPVNDMARFLEYFAWTNALSSDRMPTPSFFEKCIPITVLPTGWTENDFHKTIESIIEHSSLENNYDIIIFYREASIWAREELQNYKACENISIRKICLPWCATDPVARIMRDWGEIIMINEPVLFDKDIAKTYYEFFPHLSAA